jgi:hypothetical protein
MSRFGSELQQCTAEYAHSRVLSLALSILLLLSLSSRTKNKKTFALAVLQQSLCSKQQQCLATVFM